MKRVLVTGGAGFIGRETLAPLAARGFEIHCVQRAAPSAMQAARAGPAARYHLLDLLEGDLGGLLDEIRPTHLLHMAWYIKPGAFWASPLNLDWAAVSLRLARAFTASGGHRAVVSGTCAEYDWNYSTLHETETPLRPRTLYGRAKASVHELLQAAAPELGLSLGWGRIFFPYGPFDQPGRLIADAIDRLSAGEVMPCTDGRNARAFIHVEDAAEALVSLLDSSLEGAVNIATAEVATVREVVATIAGLLHADGLAHFGARPDAPGEPPLLAADVGRLYRELGFTPKFSIGQGLAETVAVRLQSRKRAGRADRAS
jgi:nucleoside-diphosphate-sugar epimerase